MGWRGRFARAELVGGTRANEVTKLRVESSNEQVSERRGSEWNKKEKKEAEEWCRDGRARLEERIRRPA